MDKDADASRQILTQQLNLGLDAALTAKYDEMFGKSTGEEGTEAEVDDTRNRETEEEEEKEDA